VRRTAGQHGSLHRSWTVYCQLTVTVAQLSVKITGKYTAINYYCDKLKMTENYNRK